MKLGSFFIDGQPTFGAVVDDAVVDLGARLGQRFADLRALLTADGGLEEARRCLATTDPSIALDQLVHRPVIPNPGKIFCIGVNYADHLEETKIRKAAHPTVFLRYPESQVGHEQPLLLPPESTRFDFEGEVAVIIGHGGRRISPADAWRHIAGYSCYNDGSMRDWQFHTTQWTPGKNFAASGAFGPWMTSADELDPSRRPLTLTTRLNGTVVQQSDTSLLIFDIPELIAYCSTILPLAPGDVIVTGTPGGVGMARTPPLFMQVGDVVEVEVAGIGVLRNRVEAERAG
ncbi:5-carboxymethyl-2-hydroxymuconate isomerase [Variovorax sp. WS11]|uniref:fumarylacetoacetate hydrolase family protein n=1 Tax=Variovorax sp. WS11 TaxID=1105204 RepID=UPI000D0CC1F1|nr:fumarylacetoacetate hydrolase family protein [Variovorax sp. WS11]NDZ14052.1 fumarylacetoacetate hydrolase family protein [Variovorax sp. WS11]PSL81013.1 5-carboxymethyl-2-hydroxymuconate isomerase [Variovorax sp. WS11]